MSLTVDTTLQGGLDRIFFGTQYFRAVEYLSGNLSGYILSREPNLTRVTSDSIFQNGRVERIL